tara:strand:- start:493 stop:711 length:219 start_codon:yes stop_codon:yes gene_type:complete
MSDLFRKEALENRSRALYGEVALRGPLSSWLLTGLILLFAMVIIGVLFGLKIETGDGPVRLVTWLLSGAKDG